MSTVDTAKLDAFMQSLEKLCPSEIRYGAIEFVPSMVVPQDELIHELVFSMLLWESSLTHAIRAMEAIRAELADYNELRVCFPEELSTIIGTRYPQSLDRCERLIASLNAIFQRQQELSLTTLHDMPKRDARQYLATLDGMPAFVAARVTLISLGGHAFPLDGLLMKYLTQENILTGTATQDEHMNRLERAVRAADSRRLYGMIEYWADRKRNTSSALDEFDAQTAQVSKPKG